jgi:small subunit ribosomal protein S20
MANTKSAAKRDRQNSGRTLHNKAIKTRVKTSRKALKAAIEAGDKAAAIAQYNNVASAADRAAKNGVIHKHSASRIKGIYARQIAALA